MPSPLDVDSPADLEAVELRELYATRALSPVDVMEAVLSRIDAVNPSVNAFITLTPDLALDRAREAEGVARDAAASKGPLLGIPISVKDTIVSKGVRTTMGSRSLAEWVPTANAPALDRAGQAGAALLGKTNCPEFGWKAETSNPLVGSTVNPWNTELSPGGSSGGAAAAVALGMGPLALASDAAGSIRIPAALTGTVGYKPSFGRVPVAPGGGMETLPHVGVIARSVRDVALLLDVVSGQDYRDRLSLPGPFPRLGEELRTPVESLRVLWSADLGFAAVEEEPVMVAQAAAFGLSDLGWSVEEVPSELEDPFRVLETLVAAGMAGAVRNNFDEVRSQLDPDRLPLIEKGFSLSAADVGEALAARALWVERLQLWMQPFDLLVTPTVPVLPFRPFSDGPGSVAGSPRPWLSWASMTYAFNLSGQPAITVPCGFCRSLPVGLQFVGKCHDDVTVLRAAATFESAASWKDRWPPLLSQRS